MGASDATCCARSTRASAPGELQIVALNDLCDPKANAHLTRYDTVHGRFDGEVRVDGDYMVVNGDRIRVFAERDPAKLPWGEVGVEYVLECTGLFTSKAKAERAPEGRGEESGDLRARAARMWTRPSSTA